MICLKFFSPLLLMRTLNVVGCSDIRNQTLDIESQFDYIDMLNERYLQINSRREENYCFKDSEMASCALKRTRALFDQRPDIYEDNAEELLAIFSSLEKQLTSIKHKKYMKGGMLRMTQYILSLNIILDLCSKKENKDYMLIPSMIIDTQNIINSSDLYEKMTNECKTKRKALGDVLQSIQPEVQYNIDFLHHFAESYAYQEASVKFFYSKICLIPYLIDKMRNDMHMLYSASVKLADFDMAVLREHMDYEYTDFLFLFMDLLRTTNLILKHEEILKQRVYLNIVIVTQILKYDILLDDMCELFTAALTYTTYLQRGLSLSTDEYLAYKYQVYSIDDIFTKAIRKVLNDHNESNFAESIETIKKTLKNVFGSFPTETKYPLGNLSTILPLMGGIRTVYLDKDTLKKTLRTVNNPKIIYMISALNILTNPESNLNHEMHRWIIHKAIVLLSFIFSIDRPFTDQLITEIYEKIDGVKEIQLSLYVFCSRSIVPIMHIRDDYIIPAKIIDELFIDIVKYAITNESDNKSYDHAATILKYKAFINVFEHTSDHGSNEISKIAGILHNLLNFFATSAELGLFASKMANSLYAGMKELKTRYPNEYDNYMNVPYIVTSNNYLNLKILSLQVPFNIDPSIVTRYNEISFDIKDHKLVSLDQIDELNDNILIAIKENLTVKLNLMCKISLFVSYGYDLLLCESAEFSQYKDFLIHLKENGSDKDFDITSHLDDLYSLFPKEKVFSKSRNADEMKQLKRNTKEFIEERILTTFFQHENYKIVNESGVEDKEYCCNICQETNKLLLVRHSKCKCNDGGIHYTCLVRCDYANGALICPVCRITTTIKKSQVTLYDF